MDSDFKAGFILGFFIAIALGYLAAWQVRESANKESKREAVAAGHAEFVADKEGNVTFKWKENCK